MTFDFRSTSVTELAGEVRNGKTSARDLVQAALDRIDALNDRINAFVAVDPEAALRAAASVDEQVATGRDPGPLAGIPLAVKDLEDAAGFRTTKGSPVFESRALASADSLLVQRLKAAGCVVVGKTNTPELGWKPETDNSVFGATRNPWNLERSPGGSSGGAAAALASGMIPLATGSDGGGSIRIPAACCGLPGFKPSLGRIPAGGPSSPDWAHLSTRGPMARHVRDVVAALDAVVGPDPTDLRSLPMPDSPWRNALEGARLPVKVAWSATLGYATVDDEVLAICRAAVDKLGDLGAEVVDVGSVFPDDPALAWGVMTSAYNARTLGHLEGTDVWERIDPGLRSRIMFGKQVSAVDLVKAEDRCHELNLRLVDLFRGVRVLLTPTTAAVAPLSGRPGTVNGSESVNWVSFTYPFNMTRSPAGSVSVGISSAGVPVGLQVVGPQHADLVVLRTMAVIEAACDPGQVAPIS